MSSGSQTVGDAVVSKFDMHVYTSVLTSNEVKNLAVEYAILLDLHPFVPPSGLNMNRLPVDKIVATSMSQLLKFLTAGGVRGGKGTALAANEVIPQYTTQPLPFGSLIPKKSNHQKVVEYENERVLAAKRKAQVAKDRAVRKRVATEGASHRPKKEKTTPLSFALSDYEADESNRSGSCTHLSASPLNTIIPNDVKLTTEGDDLILESAHRVEEDTDHNLDNVEDTTEVNSPLFEYSPFPNTLILSTRMRMLTPRKISCVIMRNPSGDDIASSIRGDVGLPVPFVPVWNLTTYFIFNDAESYRDMMINLATPAVRDQQNRLTKTQNQPMDDVRIQNKLSNDHKALQQVHLGCVGKEADLTEKLVAVEKETDDLLDKNREREEHNYVRQLFPTVFQRLLSSDEYKKSLSDDFNLAIAAGWSEGVKIAYFEEDAEAILATVNDYDPECKTTFMSAFDSLFTKSYPYVEKLVESFQLPLGDLQNIWPNFVACTEAHYILVLFFCNFVLADGNGFGCKLIFLCYFLVVYTFKFCSGDIRHLAIGAWTHLERLTFRVIYVSWPLALDSSRASCAPDTIRHLAIGAWTHPERLVFWVIYVTWPLALTGASCVPGKIRHLAIGAWTHPERLAFRVNTSLGHWRLDSSEV
nr:hypothetical protein [Tanacetum cinerariifolium]